MGSPPDPSRRTSQVRFWGDALAYDSSRQHIVGASCAAALRHHEYRRDGLPIATGVIESRRVSVTREGPDGHQRRAVRWCLEGGEAVSKLRSLRTPGDLDECLAFHRAQELDRNHLRHFQESELADLGLAA
jgi:hypothetical protein